VLICSKLYYASNVFFLVALDMSKLSNMLFFRRLTSPGSKLRLYNLAAITLLLVSTVVFLLATTLQCNIHSAWTILDAQCTNWVRDSRDDTLCSRANTVPAPTLDFSFRRLMPLRGHDVCGASIAHLGTSSTFEDQDRSRHTFCFTFDVGQSHTKVIPTSTRSSQLTTSQRHTHNYSAAL
jgi:hypothetical protein